ncbi:peroxisomal trans-2-enoyl-CoA reductase [Folsomia candida]|uniref:peroxisomal trans-2-enoyl-CoA reductase n=1 Tax=Folsomia candida TaxID=158441 RepID=UPI000B8EEFFB|nr:peroxisomal trans-2-enoyl-CoA reductase [Folsomia candida]
MSVLRPELFKNCVAIVTGGGTGIGRAITYELLTLGAKVVIASRSAEKLQIAVDEFAKVGSGNITSIPCNIRKENEVRSLISETLKRHGKIDFLVNNGGGQFLSPAADMTLKGWNAVIETNLTGTYLMMRETYTQWMRDNGGAIVNIIADMWRGFPMMSHTGAARAAVLNLTKSVSVEWAQDGVRVNCVAPGVIQSPTAAANYNVDVFEEAKKRLPSWRTGRPDEVSGAVCFLLSPAARFISGTCLNIDAAGSLYSPLFHNVDEHDKLPEYKWIPDPPKQSKL